jgi:hypothetical protein
MERDCAFDFRQRGSSNQANTKSDGDFSSCGSKLAWLLATKLILL